MLQKTGVSCHSASVIIIIIIICVRIDNSTFERVEEFKYLGTTLTNQNSIPEEIKSRLRSGNAYYHSVQNLLFSRLLFKNLKIKIYRTMSSGQSFWLQIQRSRVRSPALPDFLSSSGSGTGSTQPREPREVNCGAT